MVMSIEARLRKLERQSGKDNDQFFILPVVIGGLTKEEADQKVKAELASLKAKNPHISNTIIIRVQTEEQKQLIERIGEGL